MQFHGDLNMKKKKGYQHVFAAKASWFGNVCMSSSYLSWEDASLVSLVLEIKLFNNSREGRNKLSWLLHRLLPVWRRSGFCDVRSVNSPSIPSFFVSLFLVLPFLWMFITHRPCDSFCSLSSLCVFSPNSDHILFFLDPFLSRVHTPTFFNVFNLESRLPPSGFHPFSIYMTLPWLDSAQTPSIPSLNGLSPTTISPCSHSSFPLPSFSISLGGPAFLPGFCRPRCENWRWKGRRRRSACRRSRPQSLFLWHFAPQWSPPPNCRLPPPAHSSSAS